MLKKQTFWFIVVIILAGVLIPVKAGDLPYKEGELIVRFAPKADKGLRSISERNQILTSVNAGTVKTSFKLVSGLSVVKLPAGLTVADTLPRLKGKNEILYVEPNYKYRPLLEPDDPCFDDLWGMHNEGQTGGTPDADIDAPPAWSIVTGGNIIVAVIDTGIGYGHPDLTRNMWTNPVEETGDKNSDGYPGVEDVDDDGDGLIDEDSQGREPGEQGYNNDLKDDDDENGYVDDIYGYDFGDDNPDPFDWDGEYHNHGTCCAGIIGAEGYNYEGVTGVCWGVELMALKVVDANDEWLLSAVLSAIEYGIDNGAKVLSNSWGGYIDSDGLKEMIEAADANGVLFVASAGNDGNDTDVDKFYPSGYDCNNIISVMATDHNDQRSIWNGGKSSNYGATTVDLAAPGSDISTCRGWLDGVEQEWVYGYTSSFGGTSAAAPYVAGACALVWAKEPNLTHLEVKACILENADKLASLEDKCVTEGRLNLFKALVGPPAVTPDDDFIITPSGADGRLSPVVKTYTVTNNGAEPLNWTASNNESWLDIEPNSGSLDVDETVDVNVSTNSAADSLGGGYHYDIVTFTNASTSKSYTRDVIVKDFWAYNLDSSQWYEKIGMAITESNDGDEIIVYPNTYYESISLEMKNITLRSLDPNDWDIVEETIIDGNGQTATIIIDVNAVLSGFTVMGGNSYNIFGITDAPEWAKAPVISNCIIRDGYEMGLESYSFGVGGISISNCIIYNNNKEGIHLANYAEAAIVENCIIYDNGTGGAGSGIKVGGSSTSSIIRNNTIVDNNDFGIEKVPGAADPCISNCILWGNVAGQLDDCSATYSCIQEGDTNDWNLNSDPCFVNADSNDYHIKSYSDCVDAGDPNDPNDPNTAGLDIDGELRIINGRVDIGADELGPLCWFYPTQCHGDADGSGTVNTTDFYILRVALYTSYGDANYNPCGDFDRDGYVDDNDVNILAEYWYTYPDANCPEGGVWP
ncbi:MAG: S8 family serine peptidase, partial [Planctomycetota bacterium]